MIALKASEARKIDKTKITDPEYVVLDGKFIAKENPDAAMKPGDFYVSIESDRRIIPSEPPSFFVARILWKLFGTKQKEIITMMQRVVISCPGCGMPILLNPAYVDSTAPLSIASSVECPYAINSPENKHAFTIKEGNIMTA